MGVVAGHDQKVEGKLEDWNRQWSWGKIPKRNKKNVIFDTEADPYIIIPFNDFNDLNIIAIESIYTSIYRVNYKKPV